MNETSECSKRVNSNSTVVWESVGCGQAWGAGAGSVHIGGPLATRNGPGAVDQRGQAFLRLVSAAGATAIREHGSSGASARHGDVDGHPLQGNGPFRTAEIAGAVGLRAVDRHDRKLVVGGPTARFDNGQRGGFSIPAPAALPGTIQPRDGGW
jgi:hypothetical protein